MTTTNTNNSSESYRWLTPMSQKFLEQDYLLPGQTVDERVNVICIAAEKILNKTGFAQKFKENVRKGWYSLSTPVWANFGNNRAMPISCFGSTCMDDMGSILFTQAEVGMMSKYGGGTSVTLGQLRPRGSDIRDGGKTSGAVHFSKLFDCNVDVISQNGIRKGSCAVYLPIDHGDIEEFLTIKSDSSPIQHLSFGVTISDYWMQSMIDGDKNKRRIWAKVLEARTNTGYPYIIFIDNANKGTVDVYKDKGMKITHSNLCVAPETLLLTKDGEYQISELAGKDVYVWNGKQWSETKVVKTGTNQKLIRINFQRSSGISTNFYHYLDCTPYHKFYVNGNYENEVRAIDLKPKDRVETIGHRSGEMYRSLLEVSDIQDLGRISDTYCVNEPLEHKAVFNGVLTGQCSEILLPDSSTESFVCDLSSMNILYYDEWKNTDAVELMVYFLNAVLDEFVFKAKDIMFMERAVKFAQRHRALGIGWLGWHSYLQSKMIPWESMEAKYANVEIAKFIYEKAYKGSREYAQEYGKPELLQDDKYDRANSTLLAIAPTRSSSFIIGQVSPSIEPFTANYWIEDLAKGKFIIKNIYLENLLESKGYNTNEVWQSILKNDGSVQHLSFLTGHEKAVFKTFQEISPKEIIIQAAQRQPYIDQGQSLNLMIHPSIPIKEVNALLIEGWKLGLKSYYYQKSVNASQEFAKNILNCTSCES